MPKWLNFCVEKRESKDAAWEELPYSGSGDFHAIRNKCANVMLVDLPDHAWWLDGEYKAISPPRGLPVDVSDSVKQKFKKEMEADDNYEDATSWLYLDEIDKHDWFQKHYCGESFFDINQKFLERLESVRIKNSYEQRRIVFWFDSL